MASQEAMDKYLDSLNQAMAMHAAAAVQNLKFNKTEIAEIVDITNRNDGWYEVWNGAFRYNAFSENTTYTIGMQVHVNIPNNDYTGQKTIIGQYKREGEQGVWYRSPWENFSPDVNNIVLDALYKDDGQNVTDTGELVANWDLTVTNSNEIAIEEGPKSQSIILYRSNSLNDANKIKQRSYQDYKFIGIKADFKTLFSGLDINSGDYGIRVVLQYSKKDETVEDVKYTHQTVTLGTSDMVGSIYNFNTYYTQEALYELNKDEGASLSAIDIELYQNGDFINKDGDNAIYYYTINNKNYINNPNILMRGLDIRFGNDPIDKDNTIQIYTTNGLTYDSAQKDSLNKKNIYLRWNHLDSTSNIIEKIENSSDAANFSEIAGYKIHWYRDTIHTANEYMEILNKESNQYETQSELISRWKDIERNGSNDEKISVRIEIIESFNLDTNLYDAETYEITAAGEAQIDQSLRTSSRSLSKASDILAGEFWEPIDASGFEISFQPDNNKETSKVMAIIEYGPKTTDGLYDTTSYEYHIIKSNILEFNNMREVPQSVTADQFNGLKIYFEDNSDGNYPLYSGTTNEVLNRSDITRTRKLRAEYYSTSNGESYFNGNETIIWQIPVTNTMIVMSEGFYNNQDRIFGDDSVFTDYKSIIGDFNSNYMYLKRTIENSSTSVETTQEYQINKFYKKSAVNNSVYCYVIKNNQMAKTSVTMYFSQHGTSGTDYTFSLGLGPLYEIGDAENAEWVEVGPPDTAITLNDTRYREIIFELYDSKNEKIDLTDDQKNGIINSWITSSDNGYYNKGQIQNLFSENKIQYKVILNNNKKIRIAIRAIDTDLISCRYIILKAIVWSTIDNEQRVKFEQYLPLHFRAANSKWCLQGSDVVIYDDKGTNPSCNNDVYKIIDGTTGEATTNNSFHIYVDDVITDNLSLNKWDYPYFATVTERDGAFQKLIVPSMYLSGQSKNICIEAPGLYTCPLLIIQNKYQIPALNKWDGELLVDGTKNEVLAAMIGAGHKNSNNTFTGVAMGDVAHSGGKLSGLFGYNEGARVFELNTNGQAYIGASGNGRIYVDGNTGTIKSSAREASATQGTEFNLKENYIDVRSSDGKSSRIHLDTKIRSSNDGGTNAYFSVDNENGARLINIANDSYYLQTANYSDTDKTGLKINLKDGVFNSYGKITINGGSGSSINFDSGSSINSTGKLTITGNSESSISFGKIFKVDGGGKVTLGNLKFVDENGNTYKVRNTANNKDLFADNIKPQWMTFVTDVSGTVSRSNVSVEASIYKEITVDYTYNKTIKVEGIPTEVEFSTSKNTLTDWNETFGKVSISSTKRNQWVDDSGTPRQIYLTTISGKASGTTTGTKDVPVNEQLKVPYKDTWTGNSNVPYVDNIILTVTKVSMWALTNDSASSKTVTIQ